LGSRGFPESADLDTVNVDGVLKLNALPSGFVYPEWNSVDTEVEPNHVLDPSPIRAFDYVEIDSIQ
jgi:hypothetical protein